MVERGPARSQALSSPSHWRSETLRSRDVLRSIPLNDSVAAISVGIVDGEALLDLRLRRRLPRRSRHEHRQDRATGRFIEVQGTGRGAAVQSRALDTLLGLADEGIRRLVDKQRAIVGHLVKFTG
jgi:ribonuclease PH